MRYLDETVLMAARGAARSTWFSTPGSRHGATHFGIWADVNLGSPLFNAAFCNHVDVVRLLLEFRAEVDRRNRWGTTPLIAAAKEGHDECVRVLLDAGAAVDASEETGRRALYYACYEGYKSTAQLLLARGADVSASNGRDPFRPVFRAITYDKDKRKIGEALLATMRARTARLEAENAELKSRLARYETNNV